jgi:RNA polymerase-binding transcription factor DksA
MAEPTLETFLAAQDGFFRRYAELVSKGLVSGQEADLHLGQALTEACAEAGVSLDQYVHALEHEPQLMNRQKEGLLELAIAHGDGPQAELLRRELERGLQLMRFELSGDEPPEAFWEGMSPIERNRVRTAVVSNARRDPDLLAQVDEALSRLHHQPKAVGLCADCQGRIPLQRMLAVVYATRCVRCQVAREQKASGVAESRVEVHRW